MAKTKLTLINNSSDANNSQIVIFQKNVAPEFDDLHTAWRVISNLGINDTHPFDYPLDFKIDAADSYWNFTPRILAFYGQSYHMYDAGSGGYVLAPNGAAVTANQIEIRNDLRQGAISANIYKDGKLLATKFPLSPGQKAVFQFKPSIFIGVTEEQVTEGKAMSPKIISSINTELSLERIASADILMTGHGPASFTFELGNVVKV